MGLCKISTFWSYFYPFFAFILFSKTWPSPLRFHMASFSTFVCVGMGNFIQLQNTFGLCVVVQKFILQVQCISWATDSTSLLQRHTQNGNSPNLSLSIYFSLSLPPPLTVFIWSLSFSFVYLYYRDSESNFYIAMELVMTVSITRNILNHSAMSDLDCVGTCLCKQCVEGDFRIMLSQE